MGTSFYRLGATAFPKQVEAGVIRVYRTGAAQPVVGLESSGFFRNELSSLDAEVMQFDLALGEIRGTVPKTWTYVERETWWNEGGTGTVTEYPPKPLTADENRWWEINWVPFLKSWKQFRELNPTLRKVVPVVLQSRLEKLEEYRAKFIELRKQAEKVFSDNAVITQLPKPTPPKKYQGLFGDIQDALVSGIKWFFIVIAGLVVLYLVVTRFGNPAMLPIGRYQ